MARILVADDTQTTAVMVKDILEKKGYEVEVAIDGIEALEKVHNDLPNLVFLDVVLPKLDGYQVCRILKQSSNKRYNNIPIIIFSARESLLDERVKATSGANDYLGKPFGSEDLLRVVKRYLI